MAPLCRKCNVYEVAFTVPKALCSPCWVKWLILEQNISEPEKQQATADIYVEAALYDLGKDASKEELLDHILKISHNQIPLQQVKLTILQRLGIKNEHTEDALLN